MNTMTRKFTVAAAITVALAMAPTLSGCAAIEGVIKQQTGGTVDIGGKAVPSGFPSADVPLIAGEVIYGAGINGKDGQVWNVTIKVSDTGAYAAIKSALEGAGFSTLVEGSVTGDGATGTFRSAKYGVAVVVAKDPNGFIANYTVTSIK